jgi:hypothetical protein
MVSIKIWFLVFSWAQSCYFRYKSWEIWKRLWFLNVTSTKFPIFWLNFIKFSTPILFQKRLWKASICIKDIASNEYLLIIFCYVCVYDLLLEHFVSWHGHRSSNMSKYCQRYASTYVLNMCTRKITISMQMNQNLWNFNHVQWQAQYYKKISKITTYAIKIPWWSFIYQVKNSKSHHFDNSYKLNKISYAPTTIYGYFG